MFHVIVTIAGGRRCVVFTAERAEGPWSDGLVIDGVEGIDPDLAWDEDGTAIVTYSGLVMTGPELGTHGGSARWTSTCATARCCPAPGTCGPARA